MGHFEPLAGRGEGRLALKNNKQNKNETDMLAKMLWKKRERLQRTPPPLSPINRDLLRKHYEQQQMQTKTSRRYGVFGDTCEKRMRKLIGGKPHLQPPAKVMACLLCIYWQREDKFLEWQELLPERSDWESAGVRSMFNAPLVCLRSYKSFEEFHREDHEEEDTIYLVSWSDLDKWLKAQGYTGEVKQEGNVLSNL